MKKEILFFSFLIFYTLLLNFGCKKYDEDNGIQWQKPRDRLTNQLWRISHYQINGIDSSLEKINAIHNNWIKFNWDPEYDWVSYKLYLWSEPQMEIGSWGFLGDNLFYISVGTSYLIPPLLADTAFVNTILLMGGNYEIKKISNYQFKLQKDPTTYIEFMGGPKH